jgi:membrane-associated phospholipid phosphatase
MLSDALAAVHDGLVGYWAGDAFASPPPRLGSVDDTSMGYLTELTRSNLLDSLLMSQFGFEGPADSSKGEGTARLTVLGTPLVHLTAPPPAFFKAQLKFLRSYADLRADRIGEIDVQIDDILSFFGLVGMLNDTRRKHTLELLSAVIRLAIHVEMPLKHYCRSPRPMDYSDRVQPIIQTPDHSSFPSGHAMESFAAATVLDRLCRGKAYKDGKLQNLPFQIAHRIATNRTVAGVHFPVDSFAGALIGVKLAEAVYALACGKGPGDALSIGAKGADDVTILVGVNPVTADEDFTLGLLAGHVAPGADATPDQTTVLGKLWANAQAEWP